MSIAIDAPDLAISLRLDPYAPRAARFYVAQVDRPSPDLRDAVMLLTSELVTRALQHCDGTPGPSVSLRVWMPADVVRVELQGPGELLVAPVASEGPRYDVMLLEKLADRWSVDSDGEQPRMWFEIDRHEVHAAAKP
jgi:hypothetical protein